MANKKHNLYELRKLSKDWVEPIIEILPAVKKADYISKKNAVDMYLSGENIEDIESKTGISHTRIYGLVNKCLEYDNNETIKGYSALVPQTNRKKASRSDSSESTRGLFVQLLKSFPELEEYIVGNYTGNIKYTTEKSMSISSLHSKFLTKCRQLGLGEDDYPFNTTTKGERSLRRFLKGYEDNHISAISSRVDENSKQKLNSTGIGDRYSKNAVIPYSCVQVDGHIIDMVYATEVEMDDGRIEYMTCSRCWLFAVIDVATRVIIGYSMSQELNYNQYDVLRAIKNSILTHKRLDINIEGYSFPENGGFPSTAYPELNNALFGTIMLDNAKSHLAINVIDKLVNDLGITVNFGSVATPETRGIVERLFATLESKGYHQLPSTTGSNQRDIKRNNPENAAVKYQITYDDICNITEMLIAEYNNSPHTSLLNQTPLEEMKAKIDAGMRPCIANDAELKRLEKLLYLTKEVTVRGSKDSGKRPYIQYMNAEYRNNMLSSNFYYVSRKITILINPEDLSTVEGFLPDGTSIGILKANGEYGTRSHSLKTRKLINQYANENKTKDIHNRFATPVSAYEKELKDRATKDKKARTRKDILEREGAIEKPSAKTTQARDVALFPTVAIETKEDNIAPSDIKNMSAEEMYNLIRRNRAGGQ